MSRHVMTGIAFGFLAAAARAEPQGGAESPYFEELPVVLSATRLRQSLADAPAAVTVIDRELIRRTGARDITDVLRLVPGFQVGYQNGSRPLAYYHGVSSAFESTMQVLVDGRSTYSQAFIGGVEWNAIGVALEDIERIEVIRGPNSAAYGANAFFGMINIVTRHAAEAHGLTVSTTQGNRGIGDGLVRVGWGGTGASARLTASHQGNDGFFGFDSRRSDLANFRADFSPTPRDDLSISLGSERTRGGQGDPYNAGDPLRPETFDSNFLHLVWTRALSPDSELRLGFSHDDDRFADVLRATLPGFPALLTSDIGSRATADAVSGQYTVRLGQGLRLVAGGQWQGDRLVAPAVNNGTADAEHRSQWFGNLEWRPEPWLLINAGALHEQDSLNGGHSAPRLVANLQPSPDHTLRLGISRAFRAPSILEKKGDETVRFDGLVLAHTVIGNPELRAAEVLTRELSYLGQFPALHLGVDARAFRERMDGMTVLQDVAAANLIGGVQTTQTVNGGPTSNRGVEYQARWRPREGTELLLSQTFMHITGGNEGIRLLAPTHSSALAWFQQLPGRFELSLMRYAWGAMTWVGVGTRLDSQERLDLRLARSFNFGGSRVEAALVAQSVDGSYTENRPGFPFRRRVFATLRFDF